MIISALPTFFLRLLLPYERHVKGEPDKPLPLAKPRKQESSQEKASGAKAKGLGAKKLKSLSNPKLGSKKDRGDTLKGQEQSQVSSKPIQLLAHQDPSHSQFNLIFMLLCFLISPSPPVLNLPNKKV